VSLYLTRSQNLTDRLVLDKYQYSDIPLPSRAIEEDAMYHSHLARIRSMSAFCRLLIASHLFCIVRPCSIWVYTSDKSSPTVIAKAVCHLISGIPPISSGGQMSYWNHSDPPSKKARTPIVVLPQSSRWPKSPNHSYQSSISSRVIPIPRHPPRYRAVSRRSKVPYTCYTSYDRNST
jgi:hypothetical protein